jgi:hypothetical protein
MADVPTDSSTTWTISSGSKTTSSAPGGASSPVGSSMSGSRTTIPSSLGRSWASIPYRSEMRRPMASAHAPLTFAPNRQCTASRQSPSSSRNRSTTTVRSSGRWLTTSRCSSR